MQHLSLDDAIVLRAGAYSPTWPWAAEAATIPVPLVSPTFWWCMQLHAIPQKSRSHTIYALTK